MRFPRMDDFLPRATPLLIVALPLLIGLVDFALYKLGGNEATISKVMLNVAGNRSLVALSTAYSCGVLMGHLFFPVFAVEGPDAGEVLGRMFLVLAPTFYALSIIALGNGAAKSHNAALLAGGQLLLAAYMILAATVGGIVGKYALPQHLAPVEIRQVQRVEPDLKG